MKTLFVCSCLVLTISSNAWSQSLKVGPFVGFQNLKEHFKGVTVSGDEVTYDQANNPSVIPNSQRSYDGGATNFENTNIQGIRLTYELGAFTLRSDLAFSRYYLDPTLQRDKTSLGVGGQYAFFKSDDLTLYGLGGFSFIRNTTEIKDNTSFYSYSVDPYSHLNYALGIGSSLHLNNLISLVLDYKYSDTLNRATAKSSSLNRATVNSQRYDLNNQTKIKNMSETTQEITLGIMFSLGGEGSKS